MRKRISFIAFFAPLVLWAIKSSKTTLTLSIIFLQKENSPETIASLESIITDAILTKNLYIEIIIAQAERIDLKPLNLQGQNASKLTVRQVIIPNDCSPASALNIAALHASSEILLFFSDIYIMMKNCIYLHILEQIKGEACVLGEYGAFQVTSLTPIGRTALTGIEYRGFDQPLYLDPLLMTLNLLGPTSHHDKQTSGLNDSIYNMSIPRHIFLDIGALDSNLNQLYGLDFLMNVQKTGIPVRTIKISNAMRQIHPLESRSLKTFKKEMSRLAGRYEVMSALKQ